MAAVYSFTLLYILFPFVTYTLADNILIIFPFDLKSHFLGIRPIVLELSKRGHNVTVVTGNTETNPPANYNHVDTYLRNASINLDYKKLNKFDQLTFSSADEYYFLRQKFLRLTEATLQSSELQKFLEADNSFDVVITEQFYSEAYNLLGFKYKCPLIIVSTFGNCMKHNIAVGNPVQMRYLYTEYIRIRALDWWSIVMNLYLSWYEYFNWKYSYLPQQEKFARKYLKIQENAPSLYTVQRNAALFLINRYFDIQPPAAYLPNLVEIGGIHSQNEDEILDNKLRKALDDSFGFIYMSMGSVIRIIDMAPAKLETIINVFRKINMTILLKNQDQIENMPENVIMRSWIAQRTVLGHPKLKLFISHGGVNSIMEAGAFAVPVLSIPVFGDQSRSALQTEALGFGRTLFYEEIENKFEPLLKEMLTNNSYKAKAIAISKRIQDRQRQPLDVAIRNIERVLKNKELYMNLENNFDWLEFFLIDLLMLLLVMCVVSVLVVLGLCKYLCVAIVS